MASTKRDYYEVLELQKGASTSEIEKAVRKLATRYHPDRNAGDEEAAAKFREVQEAAEVLLDPEKRERYDRYGHAGLDGFAAEGTGFGPAGSTFQDLFSDLLGSFFGVGTHDRSGRRAGRDLQLVLDIELIDVMRGVKREITIPREENCPECNGSGARRGTKPAVCRRCGGQGVILQRQGFFQVQQTCRACMGRGYVITDPCPRCTGRGRIETTRTIEVTIPPGVSTGNTLRLRGEGDAGENGGPRGDLEIVIRVAEHPHFHRDGIHLITQVPITFSQAALGGDIEIPTLTDKIKVQLPRGIQSHQELRVPGHGLPEFRTGRKGDLRVQVIVETPTNLTPRQEELFRELAELDHKHVSPARKSFLDRLYDLFKSDSSTGKADK